MIRYLLIFIMVLVGISGCASWKKPKDRQGIEAGSFSISSVSVSSSNSLVRDPEVAELMRRAADRSRVAYNEAVGGNKRSYRMVLTLDDLSVDQEVLSILPVTTNKISLTATLYDNRSGSIAERLPLSHQLIAIDPEESREKQLLRGIVSKTFNRVHGLSTTPVAVMPVVNSHQLFDDGFYPASRSYAAATQDTEYVQADAQYDGQSATSAASTEPKVITCAVC